MNRFILIFCLFWSVSSFAQNALLINPIVGDIDNPAVNIEFIHDGSNTLLVLGGSDDKIYAVDFNDSTSSNVIDWKTDQIDEIISSISSILGTSINSIDVIDMEVNPKSKSAFILVSRNNSEETFLFEARNQADIKLVDLTNVSYAHVTFSLDNNELMDMHYSSVESNLYYSQGDFSLDASVGVVKVPFEHNSTADIKGTSIFKSNWGGGYFTEAPLEKLTTIEIDGVNRMIGVTVCAPGFSIPTTEIKDATGIIQVTEDFNVNWEPPLKVVAVNQQIAGESKTFLFDLHTDRQTTNLIRIGEKYLTGNVTDINNNAHLFRNFDSSINVNIDEIDVSNLHFGYQMIAAYDSDNLLVIDDNDMLRLLDVTVGSQSTSVLEQVSIKIAASPNPVSDYINLSFDYNDDEDLFYEIYNLNGQQLKSSRYSTSRISTLDLLSGEYFFVLKNQNQVLSRTKFVKL